MENPLQHSTRRTIKFEDLSPEMQEKAKKCTTPEEILQLAASEGYELSDDELTDIAGGWTPTLLPTDEENEAFEECRRL